MAETGTATTGSRWSSLSSRLALLIALVLVLSGLVTAVYAAGSTRRASAESSNEQMANAHQATVGVIQESQVALDRYRTDELAARKNRLETLTGLQISHIDDLRNAALRGELTERQAQQLALKGMLDYRYDDTNYFFTYTPDMVSLETPNPTFTGNMIDKKDANGKPFFREFRDVALGPGHGFVDYVGTRLGSSAPAPKVSYIEMYKPWQWVIGTGIYIDDIEKEASARLGATKLALSQTFASTVFGESGFFFVLGDEGQVVIAPEGRSLADIAGTGWGRSLATSAVKAANSADDEAVTITQDAGFNGGIEPWRMDVSRFPGLGWTLVSAVPQAEIDAPGNSQALRQALLSIGVLLLGLLIGLLASRRIVRPVESMTKAAVALEQDQFDPAMLDGAASRRDEVGTLARAFQRMGTEIVERERRLREQVMKLSVVIDRQKVEQEAGAITESDFFRDLEQRRDQLRQRDDRPT